jgi:hypothetical protein
MRPLTKPSPIYKFIFPSVIFGFLAFSIVVILIDDQTHFSWVVAPTLMGIFLAAMFKVFVWDLVDEVYDCGDALVFRKGELEQRVQFDDISNLEYSPNSPPSATIWTQTEGPIGTVISFRIPATFNPFSTPSLITDLQERVYQARRDSE